MPPPAPAMRRAPRTRCQPLAPMPSRRANACQQAAFSAIPQPVLLHLRAHYDYRPRDGDGYFRFLELVTIFIVTPAYYKNEFNTREADFRRQ